MLVFTNKGRVYWLKIYELPDAGTASKGKHVSGLINLQPDEAVKTFLAVKEFVQGQYIVMVTRKGVIKKCELTEFDNPRSAGIIAVALDDDDELLGAKITNGKNYIFLGSHDGMAIRFREDEVRPMGRPARGVRAMDLRKGDYLVGVAAVEEEGLILTLSENGYGKRTTLGEYRLTGRGCKGVINMKVTNKIGKVVEVLPVNESTDLMVITRNGQIIRVDSDTIRETGRSAQGVRVVKMEEGDQVAAACIVPDTEDEIEKTGDLPLQ
jgi:DNA gyrase subunit A